MRRYLSLYGAFLLQQWRIMLEYRVNFLIGAASTVALQGAGLLTVWVVMRQIPNLRGWTYDQVLLIYGLVVLAKSIFRMFADNLWTIGRHYIRPGGFERFLVRPIDPLFHLLADRFCHESVGEFVVGIIVVSKAAVDLGIAWTPFKLLYLLVAVLSGAAIFTALNMITAVSAFWIVESIPVTLTVYQTHEFVKYPLPIYGKAVGVLMTWLIPYGFVSFYPASYLMGRANGPLVWGGPVVACVLLLIGYRLWLFGLRHYTSTGT